MLDFTNLVGMMMQSGASSVGMDRMRHAMSGQGLGDLLSSLGGAQSGGLGGLASMAESLLGGGRSGGSNIALGGLGALAGALFGGGGKAAKGALGGGMMALLGSLAMTAIKNMKQPTSLADTNAMPLGLREPQNDEEQETLQNTAMLVLRAMINAAKADGQIDRTEMERIAGELQKEGADQEARAFVLEEMNKPMDLAGLIADVPNAEVAVQVYAASLLTIKVDTQAEQEYMRRLAEGLRLDSDTLSRIHHMLGV